VTQWSPGGLSSPQQLFQSVQPAKPVFQPLLPPGQLSALPNVSPIAPPTAIAPPSAPPLSPPVASDHFSGISRLLSQQGRLPAQPIPLAPSASPAPESPAPATVPMPIPRPATAPALSLLQPKSVASFPMADLAPPTPIAPARRPLADTFTYQFGEIGKNGSRMEAQGNCGPASAAIIIQEFGVNAPSMRDLRKEVGAPTGSQSRAYALTADQVGKAVTETLEEHNINVEYDVQALSTNVNRTLEAMKERLDSGEKVILLSSNLASQSKGHYVVVKEVRSDGSIVIDDPGRRNGEDDVYSKTRLEQTLKTRANRYGMANSMISFREA
jgi:hypothetical protein